MQISSKSSKKELPLSAYFNHICNVPGNLRTSLDSVMRKPGGRRLPGVAIVRAMGKTRGE
jgi:hypothetical protein